MLSAGWLIYCSKDVIPHLPKATTDQLPKCKKDEKNRKRWMINVLDLLFRPSQDPHAPHSQIPLCQEGWRADQLGHPLSCKLAHTHTPSVQCMTHINRWPRKLYLPSCLLRESPNLWCPGLRMVSFWIQRGSTSGTLTRTASCLSALLRGRTLVFTRWLLK